MMMEEKEKERERERENIEDYNNEPQQDSRDEKGKEYEVEKEWADRLGLDFDPKKVTPPPGPDAEPAHAPGAVPPPYMQFGGMPNPGPIPPLHPNGPMPPTYMVWAIVATICCCLPAGVVAIYFSSMVSSRYYSRNYDGARRASELAEIWIIVAIVAGVIVNALYLPLSLMSGMGNM